MNERLTRHAQKSRTREALLEATRTLQAEGKTVSIAAAAGRAEISRATAYRYFSDPHLLTMEAGLDLEVPAYETVVADAQTTRDKVQAVSLMFFDLAWHHEAMFRRFLARSMDAWSREVDGKVARRGARRAQMFETALVGAQPVLEEERLNALVLDLTATTGAEAMLALMDVGGADRKAARASIQRLSNAIMDAAFGSDWEGCLHDHA